MMRTTPSRTVAVVLCAVLSSVALVVLSAQQKPDVALKAAIDKEVVDGDLQAAIQMYRTLAAGTDRVVAAQALVRMGQCYEKLGAAQAAEARRAYEQVVAKFADQGDAAALARARLAALGVTAPAGLREAPGARILWSKSNDSLPTPHPDGGGVPSPDGRAVVYTGGENYDLYLFDVTSRTSRRLTSSKGCNSPGSPCDMSLYSYAWSPDGSQVAFAWMNGQNRELRVINRDGTRQHTVASGVSEVLGWWPDGRSLLALDSSGRGVPSRLIAVDVTDGARRVLGDNPRGSGGMGKPRLSPDGRFIAFSRAKAGHRLDSDVFVMPVGGAPVAVLEDASSSVVVGWVPDGSAVAFLSERGGTQGLWAIPVSEGWAAGTPRLVKGDLGATLGRYLTILSDGSVYYEVDGRTSDVYLVELDLQGGRMLRPPVNAAAVHLGRSDRPMWSADGRRLAFFSWTGFQALEAEILQTLDTISGERRSLTLAEPVARLGPAFATRMAGDDVIITHSAEQANPQLLWIDATSGRVVRRSPRADFLSSTGDGTKGYSVSGDEDATPASLIEIDLLTGETRTVASSAALSGRRRGSRGLAISPDGTRLAFLRAGTDPESSVLEVLTLTSGSSVELYRTTAHIDVSAVAWSPDGRYLLFGTQNWRGDTLEQLWSIPAGGGTPVRYDTNVGLITSIAVNPDGRRIALGARRNDPDGMWVLRGFLPPAKPPAR